MDGLDRDQEQLLPQGESQRMTVVESLDGKVLHVARMGTDEVVEQLEKMVLEDREINQLILERIAINDTLACILQNLLQRTEWRCLKLVDCRNGMTTDGCQNLTQALANVKRLFLQTSTNNRDTNDFFLPVRAALWVPSLRICVSNLNDNLASALADALKSTTTLVELSLSGSRRCGLQTETLAAAFQVNQSLETLDLGDCMLNDHGMHRLVSALQGHPKLQRLDLSNNSWSDQTLRALNDLLCKDPCALHMLDLSLQRRPLNISLLAPALARPSTGLKQLYASNCGLKDEETFPVMDALTQNRTLEHLDVSQNRQLSDHFLIYLAERLPHMHLKVLNIRKLQPPNGSPAAMRALSDGVRQNTTLQLLRLLFWKQLQPACSIQIYINLNRGGRRALEENIPLALWPLVFERSQKRMYFCPLLKQLNAKEDAIFHLFRNQPALWQRNG